MDEVRIVHKGDELYVEPKPERSRAQAIRDGILDDTEDMLRKARDLIAEALEQFGLIGEPQHKNLELLINQQIEQVIEFRRVKQ